MYETIPEVLAQNGVDKISIYYKKTPLINKAYTTCVFVNTDKNRIEARGVSICSLLDIFNTSKGRNKAFGRAMKALVRRKNFQKIRSSSRDDEFVRRGIKIKSSKDEEYFHNVIGKELEKIDPALIVSTIPKSKGIKEYSFHLPLSYPVKIANKLYKYKSHFRPIASGKFEAGLLKIADLSTDKDINKYVENLPK